MTRLAFVDTETTGLDPDRHEIWDVGLIVREDDGTEEMRQWFLPVDLGRADAFALNIGHYHERHPYGRDFQRRNNPDAWVDTLASFAKDFADWTAGSHLVGAVVSFDAERLTKLLRTNGACPEWHYHLIDVEALAVGYLAGTRAHVAKCHEPPWKSDDLTVALGLDPLDESERHTALGDVKWAKAIYDVVMGSNVV